MFVIPPKWPQMSCWIVPWFSGESKGTVFTAKQWGSPTLEGFILLVKLNGIHIMRPVEILGRVGTGR